MLADFFEDNRETTIILFKFGENVSFKGLFKAVNNLLLLAGVRVLVSNIVNRNVKSSVMHVNLETGDLMPYFVKLKLFDSVILIFYLFFFIIVFVCLV